VDKTPATSSSTTVRHPLDPLSADEFRRAANTLRRAKGFDERWRFAAIELKEPPKEVLASGNKVPREALLICWNRDDGQAYKAVVSIDEDRVVSWEHRPGEQPNVTVDEYHECDVALRRDPQVVEALAARGVTDMEKVLFDVWAYGGSLTPTSTGAGASAGQTSGTGTTRTPTPTPTPSTASS
jgi:primary-amine oxidase